MLMMELELPKEMQAEMLARMTVRQWSLFLAALQMLADAEYGEVTLVTKRGVVRRLVPAPSIELGKDGE